MGAGQPLIGLFGGISTGVAKLLLLLAYSTVADERLRSTAVMVPVMGGICYTVFGIILGSILGAVGGLIGVDIRGPLRCILFGVIIMEPIGLLDLEANLRDTPEQASMNAMLTVGLSVVSAGLAGAVGGALVGAFSRRP